MTRQQAIRARYKLVGKMLATGELLDGMRWSAPSGTNRDAQNARAEKGAKSSC